MNEPKPKRGRPAKKPDGDPDATFLLNCKASEKAKWKAIAERDLMSLSALIRKTMNKLK